MTTKVGLPRMVHEALPCGLKVTFNGQEINRIPDEKTPSKFAPNFSKALTRLCSTAND